jgi:protein associated with RNAse G/E
LFLHIYAIPNPLIKTETDKKLLASEPVILYFTHSEWTLVLWFLFGDESSAAMKN